MSCNTQHIHLSCPWEPASVSLYTNYYRAHGHSMPLAVTKRQCRTPPPPVELVKKLNMGRPGKVLKSFRIVRGILKSDYTISLNHRWHNRKCNKYDVNYIIFFLLKDRFVFYIFFIYLFLFACCGGGGCQLLHIFFHLPFPSQSVFFQYLFCCWLLAKEKLTFLKLKVTTIQYYNICRY